MNPLAPDKVEPKTEMLSKYQLKIVDSYNTPICNVKKIVPNVFGEGSMWFIKRTYNYTWDLD